FQEGNDLFYCFFLFRGSVEYHRAVLGTKIKPLRAAIGRVVIREKEFEELLQADFVRLKDHFHGLSVTGRVLADLTISWFLGRAAGIPDLGFQNARHALELGFQSPKTSPREIGFLPHQLLNSSVLFSSGTKRKAAEFKQ